jgi:glucose-6-phosphate isomerase
MKNMAEKRPILQVFNTEPYKKDIDRALEEIATDQVIQRIWKKDWTVWSAEPKEISDRLGWLTAAHDIEKEVQNLERAVQEVREAGYRRAFVLGMGGSSLAPAVFSQIFRTVKGYLNLEILDSTAPSAVLGIQRKLDIKRTLFIVSSKSGTTVETNSFLNVFLNRTLEKLGEKEAGAHFVAITDPATPLAALAQQYRFRSTFFANPDLGGRFSVFSPFGLFPAALKGIDLLKILRDAQEMARLSQDPSSSPANPGVYLGAVLGALALAGRDKATFVLSPRLKSFGLWLEQLLAESTGKDGKGILPVIEEDVAPRAIYGEDRVFISLGRPGSPSQERALNGLIKANFPVVIIPLPKLYSLGGQFFLWAMATAVAGFLLKVNPFDQPNVDASKRKAKEFLKSYKDRGMFPQPQPSLVQDGLSVFAGFPAADLKKAFQGFLNLSRPGDYISIQAFLGPEARIGGALEKLRRHLRNRTGLAVTWGFGPQFLHSTGQIHKGDGGNGLFIQFTADDVEDVFIPDRPDSSSASLSFGVLKAAQAWGDWEALKDAGRKVIRFHLGKDWLKGLKKINSLV